MGKINRKKISEEHIHWLKTQLKTWSNSYFSLVSSRRRRIVDKHTHTNTQQLQVRLSDHISWQSVLFKWHLIDDVFYSTTRKCVCFRGLHGYSICKTETELPIKNLKPKKNRPELFLTGPKPNRNSWNCIRPETEFVRKFSDFYLFIWSTILFFLFKSQCKRLKKKTNDRKRKTFKKIQNPWFFGK